MSNQKRYRPVIFAAIYTVLMLLLTYVGDYVLHLIYPDGKGLVGIVVIYGWPLLAALTFCIIIIKFKEAENMDSTYLIFTIYAIVRALASFGLSLTGLFDLPNELGIDSISFGMMYFGINMLSSFATFVVIIIFWIATMLKSEGKENS